MIESIDRVRAAYINRAFDTYVSRWGQSPYNIEAFVDSVIRGSSSCRESWWYPQCLANSGIRKSYGAPLQAYGSTFGMDRR